MLAGSFTNKEFQVGAYSNETIGVSIGATSSDKIGATRKETTDTLGDAEDVTLKFIVNGKEINLETVKISTSAGTGLGVLAQVINKNSDVLGGIRATSSTQLQGASQVTAGALTGLAINGVVIGDIAVSTADSNGNVRNAINKYTTETGVTASLNTQGVLLLTSNDGRGIKISGTDANSTLMLASDQEETYGRLTLTSLASNDIQVSAGGAALTTAIDDSTQYSFNLREVTGLFNNAQIDAGGGFATVKFGGTTTDISAAVFGAGVTTREGAMIVMDIAESAISLLDRIRSDIGSAQQQLEVTLNNISVTQVNVKAAESGIRDVDFGSESSNFSKQNILIQSGSYALSQANAVQQNVLRLLQ
ncbi:hypothetical protein FACS1894103_6200 [Campylobacterota bacterium]|nr:hypothetical protein FACS1894103_6200 [Campylobacterota bacterium]